MQKGRDLKKPKGGKILLFNQGCKYAHKARRMGNFLVIKKLKIYIFFYNKFKGKKGTLH